jgi:hypothetical protein
MNGYFENLSLQLRVGEENEEWGYLFASLRALCDVLSVKVDLGVRTRKAYQSGDKAALERIVKCDYVLLLERLEGFYNAFERAWSTERKPFGFEVQDIRLGGLIQRIKHCKRTLEKYLSGELNRVEELDQEILSPYGTPRGKICGCWYSNVPTTGVL